MTDLQIRNLREVRRIIDDGRNLVRSSPNLQEPDRSEYHKRGIETLDIALGRVQEMIVDATARPPREV